MVGEDFAMSMIRGQHGHIGFGMVRNPGLDLRLPPQYSTSMFSLRALSFARQFMSASSPYVLGYCVRRCSLRLTSLAHPTMTYADSSYCCADGRGRPFSGAAPRRRGRQGG